MVWCFGAPAADPFRCSIQYTRKKGKSVTEYYEEKRHLGCLADLKEDHIVSGVIDGLPTEMEIAFAGLSINSPSQWLSVARRIETTLALNEQLQPPRPLEESSTSSKRALP